MATDYKFGSPEPEDQEWTYGNIVEFTASRSGHDVRRGRGICPLPLFLLVKVRN
jgi:hypothetical protein